MLTLEGFTDNRFVEKCVEHFCDLLEIAIPKILVFVDDTSAVETGDIAGACYENEPGDYMIVLKTQTPSKMISTLAHELVHVKQFVVDELSKKFDSSIPYLDRWWEKEAIEKEKTMMDSLVEQIVSGNILVPLSGHI